MVKRVIRLRHPPIAWTWIEGRGLAGEDEVTDVWSVMKKTRTPIKKERKCEKKTKRETKAVRRTERSDGNMEEAKNEGKDERNNKQEGRQVRDDNNDASEAERRAASRRRQ
jgi:hypothetical protein